LFAPYPDHHPNHRASSHLEVVDILAFLLAVFIANNAGGNSLTLPAQRHISTAVIAVSTDGGNSFAQQPPLASVGARGGGRLISLGSQVMFLYGSHGFDPGRMMLRNDSDPLDQWSGPVDVFGEGIYHGAALSAAADGNGGLHLAYKAE
jgi:hypothetical protein